MYCFALFYKGDFIAGIHAPLVCGILRFRLSFKDNSKGGGIAVNTMAIQIRTMEERRRDHGCINDSGPEKGA